MSLYLKTTKAPGSNEGEEALPDVAVTCSTDADATAAGVFPSMSDLVGAVTVPTDAGANSAALLAGVSPQELPKAPEI